MTLTASCYLSNKDSDLIHAVDLNVIKARTNVPSEATLQAREEFRNKAMERDVCCVWTGLGLGFLEGLHIIPHRWGSKVRSTILCREGGLIISFVYFSGFS